MTPKQLAFQTSAETIIKNLRKRNMEGYFFEDSASCINAVLKMMPEGSVVSWGGSESIKECGLMNALKTGPYPRKPGKSMPKLSFPIIIS